LDEVLECHLKARLHPSTIFDRKIQILSALPFGKGNLVLYSKEYLKIPK